MNNYWEACHSMSITTLLNQSVTVVFFHPALAVQTIFFSDKQIKYWQASTPPIKHSPDPKKYSLQSSTGQLPFFNGRGHCAAKMVCVTSTLLLQFQLRYSISDTRHDRNTGTLSQHELIGNEILQNKG